MAIIRLSCACKHTDCVLTSTGSAALCTASSQLGAPQSRYAWLLFLVDVGARRSNPVQSRPEFSTEHTRSHTPKQQHNIQVLHLILRFGTLHVFVFITHTYNWGCTWLCYYHRNSSISRLQLSSSDALCQTNNSAGGVCWKTDGGAKPYPRRKAADKHPMESLDELSLPPIYNAVLSSLPRQQPFTPWLT